MSYKKKLSGFALLLLVATPLFFSISFLWRQGQIKNKMQAKIQQDSLQTLTLPLANFYWIKYGKEVSIAGKLFDVKNFTATNNKITLQGLFDNDEEALISKMQNVFYQTKKNTGTPLNNLVIKYLFQPIISNSLFVCLIIRWVNIDNQYGLYTHILPKENSLLFTPPPDFLV